MFVKFPEKVNVAAAPVVVSFHTALLFKVTSPLKAIARTVPDVDPKFIVPDIDVAPFTINGRYMVRIAPLLMVNPAQVIVPALVVTELTPVVAMTTTSVAAGTTPPTHVLPVAQSPPVAVLVIVAPCTKLAVINNITTNKSFP